MKLETIRIENFRSFKDETITLSPYTCLVGANGAGKSGVLNALNVFFRNTAAVTNVTSLSVEDFHHRDTSHPVKITLSLSDLSPEAQEDFKHYYRQGLLVVSARADWNVGTLTAEVKQFGSRLVMTDFAPYFAADTHGESAESLKAIFKAIREKYPDLPAAASKPNMVAALRAYEEQHPELCQLMEDTDQFYGWSRGSNLLAKYIQWVYVPAVKDASTEQEEGSRTALGYLLERTIRSKVTFKTSLPELKKKLEGEYLQILDAQKAVLADLSQSIETRLQSWANPGASLQLNWHYDPNKSIVVSEPVARAQIGEDSFLGEVARLGHGMQRSFLVSVLHELASLNTETGPTLVLGFEEPELYQHPPQAQHMAGILEGMAMNRASNSQLIISTHSPYFVSSRGFESVRMIRKHRQQHCSLVSSATYEQIEKRLSAALNCRPNSPTALMAKIEQIMQPSQRELYFSRVPILVEGQEDIAFLATHMHLRGQFDNFRRLGCHFVMAVGKNAMSRPLAIAKEFCIPVFVLFDADTDKKKQAADNERDNGCLLRLCGHMDCSPLPSATIWKPDLVMWHTNIGTAVRNDFGASWDDANLKVRTALSLPSDDIGQKNSILIAAILEHLGSQQLYSNTLDQLSQTILSFAESATDLAAQKAPAGI